VLDPAERLLEDASPAPRARSRAVAAGARARRRRRFTVAVALAVSFVAGVAVGSSMTSPATGSSVATLSTITSPSPPVREAVAPPTEPVERSPQPEPPTPEPEPPTPEPDDFRMPSANILCAYASGVLSCRIGTGLVPAPDAPCPSGDRAWAGVSITGAGAAEPWCTDTPFAEEERPERVLDYGDTWERERITCTSARDGLRCRNDDGGELLLSRERASYGAVRTSSDP
jgi:hypothetical protein